MEVKMKVLKQRSECSGNHQASSPYGLFSFKSTSFEIQSFWINNFELQKYCLQKFDLQR